MEGRGRCTSLSASPYGSAWFHLQAVYFIFGRSAFVCVTTPVDIVVVSAVSWFLVTSLRRPLSFVRCFWC